ncbi:hypothetical protein [Wenyingzhuangia sp. IMCC45574]
MKKNYTFLVLLFGAISCFAQKETSSVVKNMYNIQTGFGLWANNETRLSPEVALRSEVGFSGGYRQSFDKSTLAFVPGLSLEPRWYFNLKKRAKKGKDISFNSANYWSVKAFLISDSFVIATNDDLTVLDNDRLHLTANWGLKRNFSEHWNYEFGIGFGTNLLHRDRDYFFGREESPIVGNLTLRLGFKL